MLDLDENIDPNGSDVTFGETHHSVVKEFKRSARRGKPVVVLVPGSGTPATGNAPSVSVRDHADFRAWIVSAMKHQLLLSPIAAEMVPNVREAALLFGIHLGVVFDLPGQTIDGVERHLLSDLPRVSALELDELMVGGLPAEKERTEEGADFSIEAYAKSLGGRGA